MKYYYKLLFIIAIALSLGACESEDIPEQPVIEAAMFRGEWFSEETSTYLFMGYNSFEGSIYKDMEEIPEEGESINGNWTFFPVNNLLRMQVHYTKSQFSKTRDYKVISIDDHSMKLLDIYLNTEYIYYKVTDDYMLLPGDKISISGMNADTYEVVSPKVAKIEASGLLTARSTGTTFVSASKDQSKQYVRIDVFSRVEAYLQELLSSIDDVIEKYGKPDRGPAQISQDKPMMSIAYIENINDCGLVYIEYRYHPESREISKIFTVSANKELFDKDRSYMDDTFIDVYNDGSVYYENPFYGDSNFFIAFPGSTENSTVYCNFNFYFKYGYLD